MSRIPPLSREALPEAIRPLVEGAEAAMGFTPNDALVMARQPALLEAAAALVAAAYRPGRVSMELKRLVAHVSSRAAGCQYCVAHTAHGASQAGIDPAKLEAVWEFESSAFFSPAERAALALAVAAAQVPNAVTDEDMARVRAHFDDDQVVEIVGVIALFGFLNRFNHTFATELEDRPHAYAERALAPRGWSPGVHRR